MITNNDMQQITYDQHQQAAIDNCSALDKKITVLYGSAGRGKSTVANEILTRIIAGGVPNERIYICAYTGKASIVVDKMLSPTIQNRPKTIHRLLGYMGPLGWTYGPENRLECDVLLVEEASLVDSAMLARIINSVSEDCRIILSGDHKQLNPIMPGCPFRDIIAARLPNQASELVINYRQKNKELLAEGLERIIGGEMPIFGEPGKHTLGGEAPDNLFFHEVDDKEDIVHVIADIIAPWHKENLDFCALSPNWKGPAGVDAINEHLQEKLNPHKTGKPEIAIYGKPFRLGDKVKNTKNNYELDIFNGFIGEVKKVGGDGGLLVDFDGQAVWIRQQKNLNNIVLGYCITVFSSQGSQYDHVVLVIHSTNSFSLTRSLLYVGASRARKSLHIVGDMQGLKRALKTTRDDKRQTYLDLAFRGSAKKLTI